MAISSSIHAIPSALSTLCSQLQREAGRQPASVALLTPNGPQGEETSESCQPLFRKASALPTDATHQPPPCSKSQRGRAGRARKTTASSAPRHRNTTGWEPATLRRDLAPICCSQLGTAPGNASEPSACWAGVPEGPEQPPESG